MGAIQIHNKNEGLVPKPRGGKEVQKIAEKAVNTVDIKGKETSGGYGYKGHCMLLVSPDQKEKSLTLYYLFSLEKQIHFTYQTPPITMQTARQAKEWPTLKSVYRKPHKDWPL